MVWYSSCYSACYNSNDILLDITGLTGDYTSGFLWTGKGEAIFMDFHRWKVDKNIKGMFPKYVPVSATGPWSQLTQLPFPAAVRNALLGTA